MQKSTIKGLFIELHCQLDFNNNNILLSQPITSDSRYDFIADVRGKLIRVQCKHSTYKDDSYIDIKLKTTNGRKNIVHYYFKSDIDYVYTYIDDKSYLIPIEECGKGEVKLRFKSGNPNHPRIKWAKDYEFNTVIQKIIEGSIN